jgi:hypothetical protein
VNIDVYKAHRHEDVLKLFLHAQNIDLSIPQSGMFIEYVPACCTGVMQTADVVLSKPLKAYMQKCFTCFLSEQYMHQIAGGAKPEEVQLLHKLKHVAPYMVNWLMDCFEHVKSTVNLAKGLEDLGYMMLPGPHFT